MRMILSKHYGVDLWRRNLKRPKPKKKPARKLAYKDVRGIRVWTYSVARFPG